MFLDIKKTKVIEAETTAHGENRMDISQNF